VNEKDRRLLHWCRERDVEGVWIRRRANVAWVADGADVHCDEQSELGVASCLWTPARKRVLTDAIEAPRMMTEEFGEDWEVLARDWMSPPHRPEGNFAHDWPDDCLTDLRAPLTAEEIVRARALGAESAEVLETEMRLVEPGASEHEIAGSLERALRRRAISAPVVLIAADERIARFRHPIPTVKRVERALMVVVCAQRRGLIVALTRLLHFGPVPADLERRHAAVVAVDRALHAATHPGERWCDLFAVAQAAYEEHGFADEWRKHHQGGPMGYTCRDFLATPTEVRRVAEDQLVGWNPSITGTKSEDTILSTGEVITSTGHWPLLDGRPDILRR
jgi:Xaa-Pro aminopeptidase